MSDFYKAETFDYEITQGDTLYLKFQFKDIDTGEARQIVGFNAKFNIKDPINGNVLVSLQKTHNDVPPAGGGIYFYNDVNKPVNLGMTTVSQMVVVLSYADTESLAPGVYPFDIEFSINDVKFTSVKGNIIVTEEITPSV
jgi:hypothetical protein